tara:strand:- start:721 stop:1077 length:357 start_codon:yes stop_codon:yes gene_type:complete
MDIQLIFAMIINQSVQIGDVIYYSNPQSSGGFNVNTEIVELGPITNISVVGTETTISCTVQEDIELPTIGTSYVFFSKDNKVNSSTLLGYFGLAKFINNSTVKAELFATAAQVFESSK